ncbi:MAG: VWA domain-containing protein [Steroidobacteraceae bacterium]
MLGRILALFALCCSVAFAAPTLDAPAAAKVGSELTVTVSGSSNARDFVTIVPAGSREGAYDAYQYANKPGALKLQVPSKPGDYELRLLGADSPYPTLVRKALKVESVAAKLDAPLQVDAGKSFQVQWSGPDNARDYVGIGDVDPKKRAYISYVYTNKGSPITLTAPDEPGEYELRYFLAVDNAVIASKRITVGSASASVSGPAQVAAGATFDVNWQGPNNQRDFITLVKAGTPQQRYERYEYTSKGSPLKLRAPDEAGEYELRYLTAQSYKTLATAKLTVTAINASVQAPAEAVAGTTFGVKWQGPNNPQDYITIVAKAAREGSYGNYTYTTRGNPLNVLAPLGAGEYEVRYATGQSNSTLARQPIRILPSKQEPGLVKVTSTAAMAAGAVEIILDASGSMLQRLGGQRRIDIAKQTLTQLAAKTIPANTPFALRVFGREVDSCQTDLQIALSPLNAATVSSKIAALEAKNNAKTPIGASLDKVVDDLKSIRGERLVIVLTDGEETCGGDPAAAIQRLNAAGMTTRVNIVGFAIDDPALAATFRRWADLGKGSYFNAKDAAGLNDAMARALRPAFEVLDTKGQVLAEGHVDGEAVQVPAGNASVRIKGTTKTQAIVVKPKETTITPL